MSQKQTYNQDMGRGSQGVQAVGSASRRIKHSKAKGLSGKSFLLRPNALPIVSLVDIGEGRSLNIRRWSGRGKPLVLVHGLLDSSEGWDDLARSTRRPVIAIDLPGFGDSSQPKSPNVESYADDVMKTVDSLGLKSYTLVGHSLGGAVAAAMAEKDKDKISSLVLMAPAGFGHIRVAEAANLPILRNIHKISLPLFLSNPLLVNAVYATAISHHKLPSRELLTRLEKSSSKVGTGAVSAVEALANAGTSKTAFFRRHLDYQGPVHALWGRHDQLVPTDHSRGVAHALPQAKIQVWDDMGHHPQYERPDLLAQYIEEACTGKAKKKSLAEREAELPEEIRPVGPSSLNAAFSVPAAIGAFFVRGAKFIS